MSEITDAGLLEFQRAGWSTPLRELATELLAARRELAELRGKLRCVQTTRDILTDELHALRAKLAAADVEPRPLREGDELREKVAALELERDDAQYAHRVADEARSASMTEAIALRAKLAALDVEPRPLRPGDVFETPGGCFFVWQDGDEERVTPYRRLVRVDLPAAAPESAPAEDPGDIWAASKPLKVGDRFTVKGDNGKPQEVEITHVSETPDGVEWRHQPVKSAPAPSFATGAKVQVQRGEYAGQWGRVTGPWYDQVWVLIHNGPCKMFRAEDLAPAPPPEPVEKATRTKAKTFIDGRWAEVPDHWTLEGIDVKLAEKERLRGSGKVQHLERKIQSQRAEIHRLRARIKPPRPERVPGSVPLNIPPTHTGARQPEPPAEGAGEKDYGGHATLEGRIGYLERRLAQFLDQHGETL